MSPLHDVEQVRDLANAYRDAKPDMADYALSSLVMAYARAKARAEGRNEDEAVHEAFQALKKPAPVPILTVLEGGVP